MKPKQGEIWSVSYKDENVYVLLLEDAQDRADVLVMELMSGELSNEPWWPNTKEWWKHIA
jgi:hypothetical protein